MKRPVHFEILADDPESVGTFYSDVLDWEVSTWGGGEYWLVKTGEEGTPGIDGAIMGRQFAQAVINTVEVESLAETLEKVTAAAERLLTRHEVVLAEGAGGIMVPINEQQSMLDLMVSLSWPVLLVSRGGLGTINETLLSLSALRSAGLVCAGVVLCDTARCEEDFIYRDNPVAISAFGDVPVLGHVPYLGPELDDAVWERFEEAVKLIHP